MMHVNTMRLIIDDLELVGSSPIAAICASPWQPDPDSLQVLRVSSNFVFRFKHERVRRFLRLARCWEGPPLASGSLLAPGRSAGF